MQNEIILPLNDLINSGRRVWAVINFLFFFFLQIFIAVLLSFLVSFIGTSPVQLKQINADPPEFVLEDVSELPAALELEKNATIKTLVVGDLEPEDLEVAEYVFRPLFAYRYKQSRRRGRVPGG